MGKAGIHFQLGILDDLRGHQGRRPDRHDLVVLAVHDQHRDVDLFQILGEVGLREGDDAVVMCLGTSIMP